MEKNWIEKAFESVKNWIYINVIKNWKTTAAGAAIAFIYYQVSTGRIDRETGEWLILSLATYGFVIAKDGNKTGTTR